MKKGIHTTVRLSTSTFNKLHYLEAPYESHDEALNRILTEYPDMEKKVKILEQMLLERGTSGSKITV